MRQLLALVLFISACASTAEVIRGPDGKEWVAISCRRSQANCYREAGEQCPGGYDVQENGGSETPFTVVNNSRYGGFGYSGTKYRGEMLIRCRAGASVAEVSP